MFTAIDFETHLIKPGLLAPPIVCESWAKESDSSSGLSIGGTPTMGLSLLTNRPVAGANIAYDFGCFLAARPNSLPGVWQKYERGEVWDVQIAATLVAIAEGRLRDGELLDRKGNKMRDPAKGTITNRYSLAVCVQEWLGRDDAKKNDTWRLRYAELEHVPLDQWPPEARQYPVDDAVNTLQVAIAQRDSGFDFRNLPAQCHAAFCAHLGAMFGLRADPARVSTLKSKLDAEYEAAQAYAVSKGLLRRKSKKDPTLSKDTAKIKELVVKAYGDNAPKTAGGDISIAREKLEDSGDPVLVEFSKISKVEKLRTYLPSLEQAAVAPLNVRPNILLASGRASYEGMIQLMPRKGGVRECFKFRGIGSSVDYAAVELSTLAQCCIWMVGFSKLADAINDGVDPHSLLASRLNGMAYEEFVKNKERPDLADLRQAGKAANFGFPGMMGPVTFVLAKRREGSSVCEWLHRDGHCGASMTMEWNEKKIDAPTCVRCIEEAAQLKKSYLETWPEIRQYWSKVTASMGDLEQIRHHISGRLRGGLSDPAAANSYFQGLAADGAKAAVVALTEEMYLKPGPLKGSRLVVFAHDETIIDIPPHDHVHEAAMRQADVMIREMKKFVPDVKISAEPALMRYWYKEAKARYDEKGRLIPWEPKT